MPASSFDDSHRFITPTPLLASVTPTQTQTQTHSETVTVTSTQTQTQTHTFSISSSPSNSRSLSLLPILLDAEHSPNKEWIRPLLISLSIVVGILLIGIYVLWCVCQRHKRRRRLSWSLQSDEHTWDASPTTQMMDDKVRQKDEMCVCDVFSNETRPCALLLPTHPRLCSIALHSIRRHQSRGMDFTDSVRLHMLRHRATSDVFFGEFLDDSSDWSEDGTNGTNETNEREGEVSVNLFFHSQSERNAVSSSQLRMERRGQSPPPDFFDLDFCVPSGEIQEVPGELREWER